MLNSLVVVGAQWGDEGKGKITNYLSSKADIVVRYQGGNNAGHSVAFNGNTYHLQTIPSGIFDDSKLNVLGNGMVINPLALYGELFTLKAEGFKCENFIISSRANVDLEYHLSLDGLIENLLKEKKIGTTKKGIGPCYTDKISRFGVRMCDFVSGDFPEIYRRQLSARNKEIALLGGVEINYEESMKKYEPIIEFLKPYVKDTISILAKAKEENKKILFEGAQGTMLDVDFGTYPYVTSSNTISGGVLTGSGIGLGNVEGCLGIVKAYTTRVGEGPFVGEQNNEIGDKIRELAHEYGVNTHRPRRIGWLDLVQLNYSKNVNGFRYIALMLLDILGNLDEFKAIIEYKLDGKVIDYYPASLKELERVEPVYKTFKSWKKDISTCTKYEDLPKEAKEYIDFIEKYLKIKVAIVSVGPDKDQTIIKEKIF